MIIPLPSIIPTPTFAPPTPSFTDLHGSTNGLMNLLSRERPECADISQYRTTSNIVLSCVTTIFACTWIALHLDIPESDKSSWKFLWWRFCWMIIALIAPEYFVSSAMNDRVDADANVDNWNTNFIPLCDPEIVTIQGKTTQQYARELKDKKYNSRWTLTHGFLAEMEGILLYDGDKDPYAFKPEQKFFEDPKMLSIIQQIGLISLDDIQDKSKGDGVTKSLVVTQTTWFIVQCLARWASHLPVTELEVVTLAYAVLNIFIYFLWWKKPQDLSVPFRLYLEKDIEEVPEKLGVETASEQEEPLLPHSPIVFEGPDSPLAGSEAPDENSDMNLMNEWVNPISEGFNDRIVFLRILGAYLLVSMIFGALHLVPLWLSVFPSDTERKIWQVSALYVTVTPVVLLAVPVIYRYTDFFETHKYRSVVKVLLISVTVVYAVARVILLVLTFTVLRSLPKEALRNVEWTRFIPHF